MFCKEKKKPVMIAESTPFGGISQGLGSKGNEAGGWVRSGGEGEEWVGGVEMGEGVRSGWVRGESGGESEDEDGIR